MVGACEREAARPVIAGDSTRGRIGGRTGLLLEIKRLIREGMTDEEIAAAAGLHRTFDRDMIDLARAEVRADAAIPNDAAWISWGGAESPTGAA
jgi:hypothetical protein